MASLKELWSAALEVLGEPELIRRYRLWITGLIRSGRAKAESLTSDAALSADIKTILDDLNTRTSCRFTATDKAKYLIAARFSEGYLLQDFLRVNEIKTLDWLDNEDMRTYLRPTTLYRPSHFDEYLASWFALDRSRTELAAKRAAASAATQAKPSPLTTLHNVEHDALVTELNSRPWFSFPSWADLIRWVFRFPDAESYAAYPMPDRIRAMRKAPRMNIHVLSNASPQWAEDEYAALKAAYHSLDHADPKPPEEPHA